MKWHEPQWPILPVDSYFLHAWGPIYILSHDVVEMLSSLRSGSLRFLNNEDTTVGSW